MYWILQNNLFNEKAYQTLLDVLIRFEIPHSIHKVIPFICELTEPEAPSIIGQVICFGSYSMRHAAKQNNWFPGVFDLEPYDFNEQLKRWKYHMLNSDSIVCCFKDVKFDNDKFVRPIADSKVFAGRIFKKEEFEEWQHKVVMLKEDYGNSLTPDTLVQVSNIKDIFSEHRFWIVKNEIVTASTYKVGNKVIYSEVKDLDLFEFVRQRIQEWSPLESFVIDVCGTSEGLKIV